MPAKKQGGPDRMVGFRLPQQFWNDAKLAAAAEGKAPARWIADVVIEALGKLRNRAQKS